MNTIEIKETQMPKTKFVRQIWKKKNSWMQKSESNQNKTNSQIQKSESKLEQNPKYEIGKS